MKFTLKEFNEIWEHFDAMDKAELMITICGLGKRQQEAIIFINDKEIYDTSSKIALDKLKFNDVRKFERFRLKTIQRILNQLNSKKHNSFYTQFYKNHVK